MGKFLFLFFSASTSYTHPHLKMPLSNKELKRYKAVKEEKKREPEGNELLVRPKASGAGPYIRRALMLLKGDDKNPEAKTYKSIIIMGRGQAIGKVVQIAEIVKRRVKGIHQVTKLEAETITTRYTAKNPEEGLEDVDVERSVPGLYITLSLDELDTSNLGYQKPLPEDEVTEGDLMPKKENRVSSYLFFSLSVYDGLAVQSMGKTKKKN